MSESRGTRGRPNIIGIEKGIGPLEAHVVRAMAELSPPVTVRDVCDALSREGYFAYQGVLNAMNRLARKGILERSKHGTAFVYRPLIELDELAAQVVGNVLAHMGGQLDRVFCRLSGIDPDIGEKELAKLRRKVRAAEGKRGR